MSALVGRVITERLKELDKISQALGNTCIMPGHEDLLPLASALNDERKGLDLVADARRRLQSLSPDRL